MKRKPKTIAPLALVLRYKPVEFDLYEFDRVACGEIGETVKSLFNRRGPAKLKADSIKFALEGEVDKLIRLLAAKAK